jgi:hypothetical protein
MAQPKRRRRSGGTQARKSAATSSSGRETPESSLRRSAHSSCRICPMSLNGDGLGAGAAGEAPASCLGDMVGWERGRGGA